MKNARNLVLISLLNLIVSCKNPPYKAPITEVCIHSVGNYAECTDLRQSKTPYENSNLENYICTNPSDYNTMYGYCSDLRQKLIECEMKKK